MEWNRISYSEFALHSYSSSIFEKEWKEWQQTANTRIRVSSSHRGIILGLENYKLFALEHCITVEQQGTLVVSLPMVHWKVQCICHLKILNSFTTFYILSFYILKLCKSYYIQLENSGFSPRVIVTVIFIKVTTLSIWNTKVAKLKIAWQSSHGCAEQGRNSCQFIRSGCCSSCSTFQAFPCPPPWLPVLLFCRLLHCFVL